MATERVDFSSESEYQQALQAEQEQEYQHGLAMEAEAEAAQAQAEGEMQCGTCNTEPSEGDQEIIDSFNANTDSEEIPF